MFLPAIQFNTAEGNSVSMLPALLLLLNSTPLLLDKKSKSLRIGGGKKKLVKFKDNYEDQYHPQHSFHI